MLANAEELALLIKDELYEDLDITVTPEYTIVRSDVAKIYAMVKTYVNDVVVVTIDEYTNVMNGAKALDYSPLFIAGTLDGVFDFPLEVVSLKVERHTDSDTGDVYIGEFDISQGIQILNWYPEFTSLDEYLDVLMNDNLDNTELEDVPLDFDEDTNV